MKLFFAGFDGNQKINDLLEVEGVINRLQSYFYLDEKNPSMQFKNFLLDSGGFTARIKGKAISIEKYADYINKYNVKYAFNLDTNNVEETQQNQSRLEFLTSSYIIPIYHLSDFLDKNNRGLLAKFKKKYDYIGIGGVSGERSLLRYQESFYNYIFKTCKNDVKLHGLGITSNKILARYPWYSVDSTTWLSMGRYGNSKLYSKEMKLYLSKSKHHLENTIKEIRHWLKIEKEITELWKRRGIIWKE